MIPQIKIEEEPNVRKVLRRAEVVIEAITGKVVRLHVNRDYEVCPDYLNKLQGLVCEHFNVTWQQLVSKKRYRTSGLIDARHTYMYLASSLLKFSLADIGRHLDRDHTSVIHAKKKIEGFYYVGDPLIRDIETIKSKLFH